MVSIPKITSKVPTHGVPDQFLLQDFYCSLDSINKGVADQFSQGNLVRQPYEVASLLLDDITKKSSMVHWRRPSVLSLYMTISK